MWPGHLSVQKVEVFHGLRHHPLTFDLRSATLRTNQLVDASLFNSRWEKRFETSLTQEAGAVSHGDDLQEIKGRGTWQKKTSVSEKTTWGVHGLTLLNVTWSWQMGQQWVRNLRADGRSLLSRTASMTSLGLKFRPSILIRDRKMAAWSGGRWSTI